jgi:hypothetical protein
MLYSRLQRLAGWLVSLGFVALGLLYLNAAFFSAWMSGGPPSPYPTGWGRLALGQFTFSVAAFILAAGSYKLVVSLPAWRRAPAVAVLAGLALLVAPYIGRFVLQDQCLDQGGRWSNLTLECTK